jgi:hypothetical protein
MQRPGLSPRFFIDLKIAKAIRIYVSLQCADLNAAINLLILKGFNMKKALSKVALALSLTVMAVSGAQASSTQDAAGCGVGTMIFKDQHGLIFNLLATTTNGILFGTISQTFGILNCPADASVSGKIASFIDFNKQQLVVEVAQGKGDHLAALVEMYGVKQADRQAAIAALKANQVAIFSQQSTSAIQGEMNKALQAFVS